MSSWQESGEFLLKIRALRFFMLLLLFSQEREKRARTYRSRRWQAGAATLVVQYVIRIQQLPAWRLPTGRNLKATWTQTSTRVYLRVSLLRWDSALFWKCWSFWFSFGLQVERRPLRLAPAWPRVCQSAGHWEQNPQNQASVRHLLRSNLSPCLGFSLETLVLN